MGRGREDFLSCEPFLGQLGSWGSGPPLFNRPYALATPGLQDSGDSLPGMTDRPGTAVRGLIAIGVAVALNLGLFLGFDALGIGLRVPADMGSTEMADMTLPTVLLITFVPTALAVALAMILNRVTGKARTVFSSVVVLLAFLSLLMLMTLDSSTVDRVFQGVLHLVPAAALVALVSPTLRSE
jgi:hypothetical protein